MRILYLKNIIILFISIGCYLLSIKEVESIPTNLLPTVTTFVGFILVAPLFANFAFTYGDGVADINLTAEFAFHRAHGKLATVAAVQPPGRYGALQLEGSSVAAFTEKPRGDGGLGGEYRPNRPGTPRRNRPTQIR